MKIKLKTENKFLSLIILLSFVVFLFTSDAHRYTFDEDIVYQQSKRWIFQEHHPLYVEGKTHTLFEYPDTTPSSLCKTEILCSSGPIGQSALYAIFIFINHNFHLYEDDYIALSLLDFDDYQYVAWRNSLEGNHNFIHLLYGPLFASLSTGFLFKISRNLNYSYKTSIVLALFFAFSTPIWAYSNTGHNVVGSTFFFLLGLFFFFRFKNSKNIFNLILCGTSLGFGFLVRYDVAILSGIVLAFLIISSKNTSHKIKQFTFFIIPFTFFFILLLVRNYIAFGNIFDLGFGPIDEKGYLTPSFDGIVGLLFSPGFGLFIFAPILLTCFFSFVDFYKNHKLEFFMFLSFIVTFLIFYGIFNTYWHAGQSWSARYLLVIVPILLLPLGTSIEKRKNKSLLILLIILAIIGSIFNIAYVIQDANYFVWGWSNLDPFGIYYLPTLHGHSGFYSGHAVNMDPMTIWTFEYSQLTLTLNEALTHLQPDIFLLKILGIKIFVIILLAILLPSIFYLKKLMQHSLR